MPEEGRKSYPMMPAPHWWGLRRKFRSAIPREITNNYLAAALGMSERSAAGNIVPALRITGIIDKDNKPTELAVRWRDDAQYPAVCEEIRGTVYPQELRDLAPDVSIGRQAVQTWFANHTGIGESGTSKMASFYLMLLAADVTQQSETAAVASPATTPPTRPSRPPRRSAKATSAGSTSTNKGEQAVPRAQDPGSRLHPDLNINVQIHIAADAPAEQIDQIFASMAKHLKDFG